MARAVQKEEIAQDESENKLRKDYEDRMKNDLKDILDPQKLIKRVKPHRGYFY